MGCCMQVQAAYPYAHHIVALYFQSIFQDGIYQNGSVWIQLAFLKSILKLEDLSTTPETGLIKLLPRVLFIPDVGENGI